MNETGLIHLAVARQAALRPDALAVVHGDTSLTYAQLDAAAGAYAARLAELGVRPQQFVPVSLPRGPRMLAVLLAVLKVGAAYSALDHRWPRAHLASLLRPLAPPVLVIDAARDKDDRADGDDWPVPVWSPGDPVQAATAPRAPSCGAEPTADSPAMVFFTSGTTGRPKAVVSPHRATMRLFGGDTFAGFGPGWVMPQTAAVPWDAFALEVWGMLTAGGTCVIPQDDRLLPDELRDLVKRHGANQLWLTSSLFNLFVDEDLGSFDGMRRVLTGGERLSPHHVRRFLDRHPDISLVNGYGPVESCVFATTHAITPADCDRPAGVPLGRPVPGTRVFVLDGDEPVPTGHTGEICLAGTGLALGYLDADPAAAARFTVRAVRGRATRLYRTGDLGAFDEHGVLHFAGRADRQVKVAGHRVEPAEIESAVRRLSGIRDCTVLPVPGDGGAFERLALFYTADPDRADPSLVRRHLGDRLPPYLVPGAIRRLSALPRTANGKVDHRELLTLIQG